MLSENAPNKRIYLNVQTTETVYDGQDYRRRLDCFSDFSRPPTAWRLELLHHQVVTVEYILLLKVFHWQPLMRCY